MATIPDIKAPNSQFVSVNTLSGLSIGTTLIIQNKGSARVLIMESATQPDDDSIDGYLLSTIEEGGNVAIIDNPTDEIWVKSDSPLYSSDVNVQGE